MALHGGAPWAYTGAVARWDVFWVDLEPHVGSDQGGERRPAVVVSNDAFDQHFDVVTVVPLTKREEERRRVYSFEVLAPDLAGTGYESIIMPQQVRTLSKLRLLDRVGALEDEQVRADVETRLLEHLGIDLEPQLD